MFELITGLAIGWLVFGGGDKDVDGGALNQPRRLKKGQHPVPPPGGTIPDRRVNHD